MARRIGLAQALINDPDLLILDEPTTGLDPLGTRQIKNLIADELKRRGKTVILCSHLLGDVEDICDRVCILYGGKRRALGDIRDLLSRNELTQITAEKLTPETIDRIRQLVEKSEGKELLDVTAPSDKLETFFLRIVREAQRDQVATSGVLEGTGVADFLRSTSADREGTELIDTLVQAGAETEESEVEAAVEPSEAPVADTELIEGLVGATQTTPEEPPARDRQPLEAEPDESQADRAVIDDLIDSPKKEDDRGA
jgi:ABC-2 type transport system ATP-binding protein